MCGICGGWDLKTEMEIADPLSRSGLFARCSTCGTLNFVPFAETAAYSGNYYGCGDQKIPGIAGMIRKRSVRVRAGEVCRRSGRPGVCLDIGCGDGDFLATMKDLGWQVRGSELPGRAYDRAASRLPGLIHCGAAFDESCRDGEFDMITLWQVFEHLPNPLQVIQQVKRILRDGGGLAISVPDPSSWQALLGKGHWLHLDPPRHLHLLRPDQLAVFLESQGFELLAVKHPWLEYGPVGFVQTCLNCLGFSRDGFFEHLKAGWSGVSFPRRLMMSLAVLVLLPFGIVFALAESAFHRSATFEIYARKKVRA